MTDVTQILSQIESGDPSAADQLLPLVYEELRKLAAARLAQEKPDVRLPYGQTPAKLAAHLPVGDAPKGAGQITVEVRARVGLAVRQRGHSVRMTAAVRPGDATGKVVFQRFWHGRWVNAAAAEVKDGTARATVDAGGATRVRARFTGGDDNAASAWAVKTLR
jgi:hypothetical protein